MIHYQIITFNLSLAPFHQNHSAAAFYNVSHFSSAGKKVFWPMCAIYQHLDCNIPHLLPNALGLMRQIQAIETKYLSQGYRRALTTTLRRKSENWGMPL